MKSHNICTQQVNATQSSHHISHFPTIHGERVATRMLTATVLAPNSMKARSICDRSDSRTGAPQDVLENRRATVKLLLERSHDYSVTWGDGSREEWESIEFAYQASR